MYTQGLFYPPPPPRGGGGHVSSTSDKGSGYSVCVQGSVMQGDGERRQRCHCALKWSERTVAIVAISLTVSWETWSVADTSCETFISALDNGQCRPRPSPQAVRPLPAAHRHPYWGEQPSVGRHHGPISREVDAVISWVWWPLRSSNGHENSNGDNRADFDTWSDHLPLQPLPPPPPPPPPPLVSLAIGPVCSHKREARVDVTMMFTSKKGPYKLYIHAFFGGFMYVSIPGHCTHVIEYHVIAFCYGCKISRCLATTCAQHL